MPSRMIAYSDNSATNLVWRPWSVGTTEYMEKLGLPNRDCMPSFIARNLPSRRSAVKNSLGSTTANE